MKDEAVKISGNRQKKMDIVADLSEKFGKANAVVFTNYQGLTHKQLETFKKAIKPLKAEYVVAKNSLLTIALTENKLKLEEGKVLDGQTGTLFLYEDIISPLKALAKTIKELNLPSVKFGIMDKNPITGEQVLKLSTLPTKEVLLGQLVGTLKGPIYGLHRALNWNLQKLVMTLDAVAKAKPATAAVVTPDEPSTAKSPIEGTEPAGAVQNESVATTESQTVDANIPAPAANLEPSTAKSPVEGTNEPESVMAETKAEIAAEAPGAQAIAEPNITEPETIMAETKAESLAEQPAPQVSDAKSPEGTSEPEPETILEETAAEVVAEQPETSNPTIEAQSKKVNDKGGEN